MSNEITTYKGVAPTVFKKIEPTDYSVNPFEAHKQFTFYSGSAVSENYSQLQGIYVEGFPNISSSKPFNDAINSDGSYQFAIYNSIDQLFYKRKHEPSKTHGPTDLNRSPKFLYESASVFSIPQIKMGDRIKPASFTLTSSLADDNIKISGSGISGLLIPGETFSQNGNPSFQGIVISSTISPMTLTFRTVTGTFDISGDDINDASEDFTHPFSYVSLPSVAQYNLLSDRYSNIYNNDINTGSFPGQETFSEGFNEYFDESRFNTRYPKSIIDRNGGNRLSFQTGISGSYGSKLPIGKSVNFKGSGYIETDLPGTYDRYEDYAISFFISASVTSHNKKMLVLGKVSSSIDYVYPFKIELSGSKQLHFSAAGATNYIAQITSSTAVTSSWHHVVCQKSGSNLELWLNGIKHSSGSFNLLKHQFNSPFTSSATINNDYGLKIGGYGSGLEGYSGYLDEIRIFNKTLTQAHISTLMDRSVSGGVLQTNRVGNVFNKQGLIVISSPDYRYNELITTNYTASYKSTVKLYEHSILARVDENDFNISQNPSILTDNNMNIQSWATGSDFVPYITTIGLYNDVGQLLAIGKLGQPVKNRNDIDMNFLISIDLDKNKPVKNNSKSPPPPPATTVITSGNFKDIAQGTQVKNIVTR
tara:strand:+ start:20618 stop:22558 length:1941 start_codon:yes stop_codon:yes gene_type:complete